MDITAENYNESNEFTHTNNKYLVDKIIAKEGEETVFDTVLDIGCGSGNVTKNVAGQLKFNRLVGLDIDSNMIRFANENNTIDGAVYYQADLQSPWDDLNEQLQQLENKCSLIYSVYTVHWCPDLDACLSNIKQFLAPGARAYILVPQLQNALPVPGEKRELLESLVPMTKNYRRAWKKAVRKVGLKAERHDVKTEMPFPDKFITDMFEKTYGSFVKKYIQDENLVRVVVDELRSRMETLNVGGQKKHLLKMTDWLLIVQKPKLESIV